MACKVSRMASLPEVPRDEVTAALAARRELGVEFEAEIADSLADRIDRAIDARVDARLAERGVHQKKGDDGGVVWIALGSLGMGIPITAIAGGTAGLPGILAAWLGIAIINVAYIVGTRR